MSRLFVPPADAYALTFTPKASDIDANGHVNNVVYLGWAQDLAITHWDAWTTLEERAPWSWIARRHEVDRHAEPVGVAFAQVEQREGVVLLGGEPGPAKASCQVLCNPLAA